MLLAETTLPWFSFGQPSHIGSSSKAQSSLGSGAQSQTTTQPQALDPLAADGYNVTHRLHQIHNMDELIIASDLQAYYFTCMISLFCFFPIFMFILRLMLRRLFRWLFRGRPGPGGAGGAGAGGNGVEMEDDPPRVT